MTSTPRSYVDLYVDTQSQPGKLVPGLTGSAQPVFSGLMQYSHVHLRIFPVKPTGQIISAAWASVPVSSFGGIKLAIGVRKGSASPYAVAGVGTAYAFTAQSTADSEGLKDYWYGELNLNTTEMNSAVGTAESILCHFEIAVSVAATYRTVLQIPVTVYSACIDPGGAITLPTSAAEVYTKEEVAALFVPRDARSFPSLAGATIILVSPDGASTRELGVADDKSATDNLT